MANYLISSVHLLPNSISFHQRLRLLPIDERFPSWYCIKGASIYQANDEFQCVGNLVPEPFEGFLLFVFDGLVSCLLRRPRKVNMRRWTVLIVTVTVRANTVGVARAILTVFPLTRVQIWIFSQIVVRVAETGLMRNKKTIAPHVLQLVGTLVDAFSSHLVEFVTHQP